MSNGLNPLYAAALKKRPIGLGGDLGEESMMSASMTPQVDFSKETLGEQMLKPTKTFEDIGGTDVTKETPSTPMDYKSGGLAAAKTAAQGGSGADVLSSGLIATGHPVAIAAGLGLATISSAQKAKQKRRNQEYERAVLIADQRRKSLENLANIGQRLSV